MNNNANEIVKPLPRGLRHVSEFLAEKPVIEPATAVTKPVATVKLPEVGVENPEWRKKIFGLDESDDRVRKCLISCERYLRRAINNDRSKGTWLLISGPVGTGKTHAARAVFKQFSSWSMTAWDLGVWKNARADFLDWPTIRSDKFFDTRMDEVRGGNGFFGANLVVLDDIGAEVDRFKTGEEAERLRQILTICENKWLLVTSNLPREKFPEVYDARVASRLSAAAYVQLFGCKDWRKRSDDL